MRRLLAEKRAGLGPLVALAMPVLIGAGALAVDIGAVQLESRRLQGAADAAALAAATDMGHPDERAQAMARASQWARAIEVETVRGRYVADPARAVEARFTPGGTPANAVEVTLRTTSPTFLAAIFGRSEVPIARRARAARVDVAAFAIGSRLAALDGGLLNQYLSALTGSNLSLSVLDYQALAGAQVDLLGFVDALRTTASLEVASFDEALDAQVTMPQLVAAAGIATIEDEAVRGLLGSIAAGLNASDTVRLGDLIDLGPLGARDSAGGGLVRVDALSLLTAVGQLSSGERQLELDLGAGLPGLAHARVRLAVGERPQGSPWIAITDHGQPVVRTAQARIYVEARLANIGLPGLGTLVGIHLPLFVELAEAEARLQSIGCPTPASASVELAARPGLGRIAIGRVDTSRLDDFSRPLSIAPARIVDTLLIDVDARGEIALGREEPWQTVRFSADDIAASRRKTISSGAALQGATASLVEATDLTPRVLGLPLPTGPLVSAVGSQLRIVAPALDGVVNLATGALGVRYGQADVWVTGLQCGQPVLVG